jgi:Na+-transporting methylmalonyl-CoA/oxaloacetate decarboxylase beta subunit
MRSTFAVITPLLLLLGIGAANAADPTLLAATGGFLLGNAHRCGIAVERVERATKVIHGFIVAAAKDSSEAAAADSRFAAIFLATSLPTQDPDAFPSCAVVIQQFDRLERHHEEDGMGRETQAARPAF